MMNSYVPQNFIANLYWLGPLVVIDLILKLFALWRAARNNQLYWFIALGVINSVGILPIVYLLFFRRDKKNSKSSK